MQQQHSLHFRLIAIAGYAALMALAIETGLRRSAIAQDDSCYIVTSAGKRVALGQLCGQVAPAPKDGIIRAKIKRRIAATPVIDVTFNGRQTFEMILDTGASSTLITREMARSLQVKPVASIRAGIADGSTVQFPVGYVQSLSISQLTAKNLMVAIAPEMGIGLLGHDFFGNYDVKIKRDVIEFYPRPADEE